MDENRKGGVGHVPFRQAKLTFILRDSFTEQKSIRTKMIMIGCVSPGNSFTDYSLNTLWYASKLGGSKKQPASRYTNGAISSAIGSSTALPGGNFGDTRSMAGIDNRSMGSSAILKTKTGVNTSFEDRASLTGANGPAQTSGRKFSIEDGDSDNEQISQKPSPGMVAADKTPHLRKPAPARRQIFHTMNSGGRTSIRKDDREEPRKNNLLKGIDPEKPNPASKTSAGSTKGGQSGVLPQSHQVEAKVSPSELFGRYIDALKWESEVVRQEARLAADSARDFEAALATHRHTMLGHIQSKISMLVKLQSMLEQT